MFHADKRYDSDRNCKAVFGMMCPNIQHMERRNNSNNRKNIKSFRRRAAKMFDPARFQWCKITESIFGSKNRITTG